MVHGCDSQMNLDAVGGLLVAVELSRFGTDVPVMKTRTERGGFTKVLWVEKGPEFGFVWKLGMKNGITGYEKCYYICHTLQFSWGRYSFSHGL